MIPIAQSTYNNACEAREPRSRLTPNGPRVTTQRRDLACVGRQPLPFAVSTRYGDNCWVLVSAVLHKFKSTTGDQLKKAMDNGKSFEIVTNSPIPKEIKEWLDEMGIPYTEVLE